MGRLDQTVNRPKRSKDYSEIRQKVQEAAILIAEGASEKSAAWKVGLPRVSLQRYLANGRLPDGLPIWPDDSSDQTTLGSADAAQGIETEPLTCPGSEPPAGDNREQEGLPAVRDSKGRFLPGNQESRRKTIHARKARRILAEASPEAAEKLLRTFRLLPSSRPDLILAYAKEILDRGIGKPTQSIELREESVSAEALFIHNVIERADEATIREMQRLAGVMEEYARESGRALEPGQVEIIPPPGGALDNLDPGRFREGSEAADIDATAAREE